MANTSIHSAFHALLFQSPMERFAALWNTEIRESLDADCSLVLGSAGCTQEMERMILAAANLHAGIAAQVTMYQNPGMRFRETDRATMRSALSEFITLWCRILALAERAGIDTYGSAYRYAAALANLPSAEKESAE